jgi:two-component system response regulator HydG
MTFDEKEHYRILAIDDEPAFLRGLGRMLEPRGFILEPYEDGDAALARLSAQPARFDLCLLDRNLGAADGLELMPRVRQVAPELPLIMLSGDRSDETAAAALRLGAFHFLSKPLIDIDAAVLTLMRAASFGRMQRRARTLESRLEHQARFGTLIGSSAPMRTLYDLLANVAGTDLPVLILGESGTGKELTARAIHGRSARADAPFVALNCGAIPETLIDSELFGHARGAFTGATTARPGVFVEADGGTLFLDEIGELPLAVQARLLRVLQEGEVRTVGGSGTRKVDVRVVAATHADLPTQVEEKRFRADLYYRLNVVTVTIPPLRERLEDLPLLVGHLVEKHASRLGRVAPTLSPALMDRLVKHEWKGNVRELENVLQSAIALSKKSVLDVDALPPQLRPRRASGGPTFPSPVQEQAAALAVGTVEPYKGARKRVLDTFEQDYFKGLLEAAGGSLSEAARISGIDRSNLRRILTRLELRDGGD